ncbi:hypothetical protein [Mycobacterium asiaticum]|uniref:Uncharacterized protein n=1 Tax=Mycobacterium asiaticum TaxID=1790 RepID=A0A1A3KC75_MYCAS|nr:hypothetical protein [Mycobacterium asiaticum]OBJ81988.1 hypothetical protein A5640_21895 [Mycobacterium asiaticum]
MPAPQFSAEIPRRLRLEVAVPPHLSDGDVSQLCDMASARLRFLLGQEMRAQRRERTAARIARQDARRVRLEAAAANEMATT